MTPEKLREGRRVLADALGTDAMPVTARERDLAQSEYRVWVANNLRELLDVAEEAARMKEDRKRLINSLAEAWEERDALRAALDDERGLRAALFKYARIILFDPRNPLAYPLEHNPHAIGSKNAQADIERCLRAAIAGAAKVDKTEASK